MVEQTQEVQIALVNYLAPILGIIFLITLVVISYYLYKKARNENAKILRVATIIPFVYNCIMITFLLAGYLLTRLESALSLNDGGWIFMIVFWFVFAGGFAVAVSTLILSTIALFNSKQKHIAIINILLWIVCIILGFISLTNFRM